MKRITRIIFCLFLVLLCSLTSVAARPRRSRKNIPRVLIIGDSISIRYTPYVRKQLKGEAVVRHHRGNAGPTFRALENVDRWLGRTKWAVIHFNWGLWDMYGWKYEDYERSPEVYTQNLEQLVQRLKKTGAKLIWATTTPVCPEAENQSLLQISAKTEREYLDAALRVMKKYDIQVNDLNSLIAPVRSQYALSDDDIHYTRAGYRMMAGQVASSIHSVLTNRPESH